MAYMWLKYGVHIASISITHSLDITYVEALAVECLPCRPGIRGRVLRCAALHLCVCTHACMHACVRTRARACVSACLCAYVCLCLPACACTRLCACVPACLHACVPGCVYTYTGIWLCAHTDIYRQGQRSQTQRSSLTYEL